MVRVRVVTPCRIHITLIDLHGGLGRVDGGIGLALKNPKTVLIAEAAEKLTVSGPLSPRVEQSAKSVIEEFGIAGGAKISIEKAIPEHVGLGSGTQTALATAVALCQLYNIDCSLRNLATIVGRGGTSGIGVAAFEKGGFILDGGHSFGSAGEKKEFSPSAYSAGISPPPVLARYNFPENWRVILAIPNVKRGAHGVNEKDIFIEKCPIPLSEVQALAHLILMKLLPALAEKNIAVFGATINEIQDIGFKRIEVQIQHEIVHELMEVLRKAGAVGVGMSSFGPAAFAFTDQDPKPLAQAAKQTMKEIGGETYVTEARNAGAEVVLEK